MGYVDQVASFGRSAGLARARVGWYPAVVVSVVAGLTLVAAGLASAWFIVQVMLLILSLGLATPLAVRKAQRSTDRLAKAWWCIAVACGWLAIAQAIRVAGAIGLMFTNAGFFCDLAFFLAMPCFMAAVILYPTKHARAITVPSALIDAAILVVLGLAALDMAFIDQFGHSPSNITGGELLRLLSSLTGLVVLCAGITIWHRCRVGPASQLPTVLWALLALWFADVASLYLLESTETSAGFGGPVGYVSALGSIVCFFLLARAAISPEPVEAATKVEPIRQAKWDAFLLPLFIPFGFVMHFHSQEEGFQPLDEWFMGMTLLLLLARSIATGRENAALLAVLDKSVVTLKRREVVLSFQASHDSLTALANRTQLRRSVEAAIKAHPDRAFAMAFIDLDNFKTVNDQLGHEMGDALLVAVGERLLSCIEQGALLARLGGDEFAVFFEGPDAAAMGSVGAARIIEAFSSPFSVNHHDLRVSASVGLTTGVYHDVSQVLKDADVAMYSAKALGKDRVGLFDQQLRQRRTAEAELMVAVTSSALRDQLVLHYQPMIDLTTAQVIGQEALLRWQHPERGLLQPGEFIGLAERSGAIVEMGWWVMRTACAEAATWPDPSIVLSVNVAAQQLIDPAASVIVEEILAQSGLDPSRLMVEITESVMVDFDVIGPCLERIRSLGVQVAIDDFGTGYSSLSYLTTLPVDVVKIDRSFVAPMGSGSKDEVLVRSLVEMTKNLGMRTVAEGVETVEQADRLQTLGCDAAQGFLFARPRSVPEFNLPAAAAFEGSLDPAHGVHGIDFGLQLERREGALG